MITLEMALLFWKHLLGIPKKTVAKDKPDQSVQPDYVSLIAAVTCLLPLIDDTKVINNAASKEALSLLQSYNKHK